jgi:hypothetical protein
LSFISSKFIGNACFHVNDHDFLSTLVGLVFGIGLGIISSKLAKALSKKTPKNDGKETDHSA